MAALLLPAGMARLRADEPIARGAPVSEVQVQAAFLLNFASFVEWPATAFKTDSSPIVIGVYGTDPFRSALEDILVGESVRGRPFRVRRIPAGGEIGGCHILFVSDSERRRMRQVIARLKGSSTLTVASVSGFVSLGGMIEFVTDRSRVRFRINHAAAQQAGLVISSKLLRLAEPAS